MKYLFHLKTDQDFGVRINGNEYYNEVLIQANRDDIARMLAESSIIETNPSKTKKARKFLDEILGRIFFASDGFSEGGNWEVRFHPLSDVENTNNILN